VVFSNLLIEYSRELDTSKRFPICRPSHIYASETLTRSQMMQSTRIYLELQHHLHPLSTTTKNHRLTHLVPILKQIDVRKMPAKARPWNGLQQPNNAAEKIGREAAQTIEPLSSARLPTAGPKQPSSLHRDQSLVFVAATVSVVSMMKQGRLLSRPQDTVPTLAVGILSVTRSPNRI
jgi:hypothetical protein